ncbi:type IV secretion system DNA-binding domain-containing protein, partial [Escherichia coli]|nr:type IV secretion system DNA-binding domain-containing protein [Escherichia coli]
TGSGKTTALRALLKQMRERQDTAVVFDLTGAYVEAFYDPDRDTILNPLDARCPSWSVFDDCKTQSELTAAAAALIPSDGGSADPFWVLAARTLFIEMCMKLIENGEA